MARTLAVVTLALIGVALLGLARPAPARPDARQVEILQQIVERRRALLEHVRALATAGVGGNADYVEAYSEWTDARVCLAREQEDAAAERAALEDQHAVLREHIAGLTRRDETVAPRERIEAEIAALRCQLRLECVGEE